MTDTWAGLLEKDEKLLWQGQPEPGVRIEWKNPLEFVLALFFSGFSVFWVFTASAAGGIFWMFGLPFLVVGFYNLIGIHYWHAHRRKNTRCSLTSKPALIATTKAGRRSLKSVPLLPDTELHLEESNGLTSKFFAKEMPGIWYSSGFSSHAASRVGFERLREGRSLYARMREVQSAETQGVRHEHGHSS